MGAVWRGFGRLPALSFAVLALFGVAALTAGAPAFGLAQPEGGTSIDGRYVGPIRWQGEVTIGDSYFECSDYQMELGINTAAVTGPAVRVMIFCPDTWLSRETGSLPLTWDGTTVSFQWNLDQGGSAAGYLAWSGVVTGSGESVMISGTFVGSWGGEPYGGGWEVTRVPSAEGGTTSTTTQPEEGGGEASSSSSSSSSTSVPSSASEDGETPGGGELSPFSLFESGDQRVFDQGGTSPAGVAMLVLVVILMLVAGGMAVQDAVAAVLGGAMEGTLHGTSGRRLRHNVSLLRPPPESPAPPYGPEGTPVTVSGPVQPWGGPDPAGPRAGFVLQPGGRYTVVGSTGPGPGHWVLVRDHTGAQGWVHRSALTAWQPEVPSHWVSAPSGAWETVHFPEGLETRLPNGCVNIYEPGTYRLGPPDAAGYRQATDRAGNPLSGTIHADRVPRPPNLPTGGISPDPPPPPRSP